LALATVCSDGVLIVTIISKPAATTCYTRDRAEDVFALMPIGNQQDSDSESNQTET
jgi:hypothetical protein